MKLVVLNQDCVVNGVPRVKGEVVWVTDEFDESLIKRVIKTTVKQNDEQSE